MRFTKLESGAWGLLGAGLVEGASVTVTTRAGEEKKVVCGKILSTFASGEALAEIAPDRLPSLIPDGSYAVVLTGTLAFFQVKHTGQFYSLLELRGPDLHPVRNPRYREALDAIRLDPATASQRFGQEIGRCGVCGRTLTNPESRRLGIGPICAGRAFGRAD